ncbi:hypothetical protein [Sinorhizobium meliloti]|uniref:hypothetical protein n=1 Tax=Rhizobium meliloti TaxID=382 RepID=UPI0030CFFA52
MKWQVRYALENIGGVRGVTSAEPVGDEAIRITTQDLPDIMAAISAAETIDAGLATRYHEEYPEIEFLCGYRKTCVWEGGAIRYLEDNRIGWGSIGTLDSAIPEGNVSTAAHKDFFFSDRLIRQIRSVTNVEREFDRIHTLTLANGRTLRTGMIMQYEPTADAVRSLWDRFGPVDIAWNINPNGNPTQNAIDAGRELGCEVMKWDALKALLKNG